MLTAEQARELTDSVRETLPLGNPALAKILEAIKVVCAQGEDRLYMKGIDLQDDPYSTAAFAHLHSLGYAIERIEEHVKISW